MWTLHALLWIVLLAGIVHAQQPVRFPAASSFSTVDLVNPVNRSSPLNTGLVAWWLNLPQINQAGTTFRDISGYGNHGILTGIATTPPTSTDGWGSTIRRGGYGELRFTGTYAPYVNAGDASRLQTLAPITLAVWMAPPDFGQSSLGYILSKVWYVGLDSTRIDFVIPFSTTNQTFLSNNITSYINGSWQHLVLTWDGATTMKMYFNGVSISGTTYNSSGTRTSDSGTNAYIGNNNAASRAFHGPMDDIRIFQRVLSSQEIWALYQDALAGYPITLNRLPFAARASAAAASPARRFFQFFRLLPDGFQWPVPWREVPPANDRERERQMEGAS